MRDHVGGRGERPGDKKKTKQQRCAPNKSKPPGHKPHKLFFLNQNYGDDTPCYDKDSNSDPDVQSF